MSCLLSKKPVWLVVLTLCALGVTSTTEARRRPKTVVVRPVVSSSTPQKQPELLLELPDFCNTPDGMTLMPDGSLILSVPNYNDKTAAPVLVKITKDNQAELFCKLPPHPDTGRIGPMGIRVAPSGDLYLADNQLFHHPDGKSMLYGKSRLLRIPVKDGQPGEPVVVANGFNVANGIDIYEGHVYITETILVPDSKPLISGVFRFKLGEEGLTLKSPLEEDPHLLTTLKTYHKSIPFGADGIAFDSQGVMFVGNFADGTMHQIMLGKDGQVISNAVFAKAPFMKSCDGMVCDRRTNKLYVADLVANAVQVISPNGAVQTLAQSPDSDGAKGELESPCEVLLRGDEVIVANMDFPVEGGVNTQAEKPYTMSVINLAPPAKPAPTPALKPAPAPKAGPKPGPKPAPKPTAEETLDSMFESTPDSKPEPAPEPEAAPKPAPESPF